MDVGGRQVLAFAAVHRLILAEQVGVLDGVAETDVAAGLDVLVGEGLLRRVRVLPGGDAYFVITAAGLAALGSDLPAPRLVLSGYRHALGVGWLWLAVRSGLFGVVRGVLTEREMWAHDAGVVAEGAAGSTRPYGVRVGGLPSGNGLGVHHPDLLVVLDAGWVAVRLQLGFVGRRRLAATLTAFGADPRFATVLYLVDDDRIGEVVESAAARVGVSAMTQVQRTVFASMRR